jgi:hypothetical protein
LTIYEIELINIGKFSLSGVTGAIKEYIVHVNGLKDRITENAASSLKYWASQIVGPFS